MSLTPWHDPPVRRPLTIPFELPGYWTPEQALAALGARRSALGARRSALIAFRRIITEEDVVNAAICRRRSAWSGRAGRLDRFSDLAQADDGQGGIGGGEVAEVHGKGGVG